jgi:hypothetical protein
MKTEIKKVKYISQEDIAGDWYNDNPPAHKTVFMESVQIPKFKPSKTG